MIQFPATPTIPKNFSYKSNQNVDKQIFSFAPGLMRTIAMNLNLGICREEEKQAKKHALIDYMLRHLKVKYFCPSHDKGLLINLNWNLLNLFSAIKCTQFVIGFASFYV